MNPASARLDAAPSPAWACPACGGGEFADFCPTSFLGWDERRIAQCRGCGLGALLPQPTDAELAEYYSAVYFGWDRAREDGKAWYFGRKTLGGLPKGRFLDVGCAAGFFLEGVRRHSGWECHGVEFSREAAAYAREKFGLDVTLGDLGQAAYPDSHFDFINANNVLEHERDPLGLLKEAARVLKPGGELLVVTPNGRVDRQGYEDYGRKKGGRGGSRDGHLFFFSPRSLELMVEKAGLKVRRIYSAGLVRGLRALGVLPRTPTWYCGYVPRQRRPVNVKVEETITEGRRWPKAYFAFKHGKERLSRLRGFWKAGFDFHLYLTK